MKKIVAYFRSSTQEQLNSIEVQKTQMNEFINKNKNQYILEKLFIEQHSGKDRKRTELANAIKYCSENRATLAFTKIDRLSRSAYHLYSIVETGVDLLCLDMPQLNTLTFGIFATIAQHEAELISSRTKSALAEVRKHKQLGNPYGWKYNQAKALETKTVSRSNWLASNEVNKAKQIISLLNSNGGASLNEIARTLNFQGIKTSRGKNWQANQVKILLDQI
jgi:DNA invertase Pin-like site-specific DNA recombinase